MQPNTFLGEFPAYEEAMQAINQEHAECAEADEEDLPGEAGGFNEVQSVLSQDHEGGGEAEMEEMEEQK